MRGLAQQLNHRQADRIGVIGPIRHGDHLLLPSRSSVVLRLDAEYLVAAAAVIEDAGFTTYDDPVHGLGGGYLPPVIASRSRSDAPVPDVLFEAGMTVVIQPNVVTTDHRAGVQTGDLVLVTEQGATPLQGAEPGLWLT